jgi:hypothetical protein
VNTGSVDLLSGVQAVDEEKKGFCMKETGIEGGFTLKNASVGVWEVASRRIGIARTRGLFASTY